MKIYNGNNLEILKTFADNSIDSVVTDPPYGLSFMGKSWDYDVPKSETWREVLRVLKPGGHLLSFFGTRTYHRGVAAIEDAGFEIRDQIGWAYGSGFPKSHNLKGEWEGWGTALKPAWEPICVARKPFDCTVAENVLQHGTGAINIDRCRVEAIDGNSTARKPSMVNDTAAGFGKGKKMGGNGSELGRWPANLIHDGSEEVLAQFPESKSGAMAQGTKRAAQDGPGSVCYGTYGGNTTSKDIPASSGSAARFFYCAKTSKTDRNEGCENIQAKQYSHDGREVPIENAYQRNSSSSNSHATVKPTDLMRYLCRLVTPPGGTVLDPFMGSGSTGKAAILEGFDFIGIELDAEYCKIANARIEFAKGNK